MKSVEERYCSDVNFHALVDMLYNFLLTNTNWSISELRDAVFVAAMKYETAHSRAIPSGVEKWFKNLD